MIITDMKDTVSTTVVMADAISRGGSCVFQKAVHPACMINKRIRRMMRRICQRYGAFSTIGKKQTPARKKGRNFLLVCDNCGEIVLDKLVLEQIAKRL